MKLKLTDGPLAGRSYDVPEGMHKIKPADGSGLYVIVDGVATWQPNPVAETVAAALDDSPLGRSIVKAYNGARVLLVAKKRKDAAELLRDVVLPLVERSGSVESIRRANGSERVTFHGGGSIVPVGLGGAGARGMTADSLYLHDVSPYDPALDHIVPTMATSSDGSVVAGEEAR